jgi:hypothetical protein
LFFGFHLPHFSAPFNFNKRRGSRDGVHFNAKQYLYDSGGDRRGGSSSS